MVKNTEDFSREVPMRYTADMMLRSALVVMFAFTTTACTIKATTKTTTDGATNVLSSTSGRSLLSPDGLVKKEERLNAFVALNSENLRHDVAKGHGEYLSSLESLLGIPKENQPAFRRSVQRQFPTLVDATPTTLVQKLVDLSHP